MIYKLEVLLCVCTISQASVTHIKITSSTYHKYLEKERKICIGVILIDDITGLH